MAIVEKIGTVAGQEQESKGKILMVVANPAVSEQTGWPIGFWAAELTHPLLVFSEAGYEVELASPNGGKVELDAYSDPRDESGYSAGDIISMGYLNTPSFNEMIANTKKLSNTSLNDYNAIFLVGGQSPMYTFKGNTEVMNTFARFYEAGKPSAAVCHATTILTDTKLSNGKHLVEGKTWTGFANSEEDFTDQAVGMQIQPYRIEDNARKLENSNFQVKPAFTPYAIKDGNLITGQQQNSGRAAAELVVETLG